MQVEVRTGPLEWRILSRTTQLKRNRSAMPLRVGNHRRAFVVRPFSMLGTSEISVGLHFSCFGHAAPTLLGLDVVRLLSMLMTSATQQPPLFLKPRHCHPCLTARLYKTSCADEARVGQLLLEDSLPQSAGQQQKPRVSPATGQKLSQTSFASSSSVPVVESQKSAVSLSVAQTADTDMMKSASCQPFFLMKRSSSIVRIVNPRSSVARGQEHWPRQRISTYSQRCGRTGTIRTSLSRRVAMRHRTTSRAPCVSNGLLSVDNIPAFSVCLNAHILSSLQVAFFDERNTAQTPDSKA